MTLRTAMALCCIGLALPACGELGDEYCKKQIECEGGKKSDVEECVADLDALAQEAEKKGCKKQFNAWFRCTEEKSSCVGLPDLSPHYTPCEPVEDPTSPYDYKWTWSCPQCSEVGEAWSNCVQPEGWTN